MVGEILGENKFIGHWESWSERGGGLEKKKSKTFQVEEMKLRRGRVKMEVAMTNQGSILALDKQP